MSQTRYCSTCGTLLADGAVICGECGARYQASPYERRATDAPGAWSQAPRHRSRDLGAQPEQAPAEEEGIQLITSDALQPKNPGATALRTDSQYDQMMATQSPMNPASATAQPGVPSGPGSPAPAPASGSQAVPGGASGQMEPPLDGCTPGSFLKRFLAMAVDGVISTLVTVPLIIGIVLFLKAESPGLLSQILIGVGTMLPAAYTILILWLVGAKGFSLGKLILGLRVTRASQGGSIGFLRSLGRSVLYGLLPPLMGLSVFLDPKKHLRGFHDRIIDSAVVDVKDGRNPLQPRPDDFERASAEHYLGESSVAVSTHDNLLTTPGAAWSGQDAAAQPVAGGSAGAQDIAQSPYAPPATGSGPEPSADGSWSTPAASGADGGWAPPPVEPVPASQDPWAGAGSASAASWGAPEAPAQQWDAPAPDAAAPPAAQGSGSQPAAPQEWGPGPAQQWNQPEAPAQPDPAPAPPQDAQSWAPPAGQSWAQQAEEGAAPQGEQSWAQQAEQAPASQAAPSAPEPPQPVQVNQPSELTSDAWDASDNQPEEVTQVSVPEEDLGDLEQTRVSPARLPHVKKLRLTMDEGEEREIDRPVVIGRNPSGTEQDALFVLKDETRSVSKTHLRVDGTGEDVIVTDLGSTNGSTILREDGSRETLVPDTPTVLPQGARVTIGDRSLSVERIA
ncbi:MULTISPECIES: RDD family protein [unclassified Brachybacterium]|uniref:RDD family protein n=1 Tax=unclassified Brachybacterium TaxID=2623841 RepID=UPI000C808B6B|nr:MULTISPECIES: RDD family protein [unclassified Brachybacterium]PMC74391.1 hypothetical protein CJ197_13750 [Brachybacterium sp. UMB0905]